MFDFDMHIQRTSEKLAKYTRVLEFPNSMDHWISTSTISWVITKCTRLEHFRYVDTFYSTIQTIFRQVYLGGCSHLCSCVTRRVKFD